MLSILFRLLFPSARATLVAAGIASGTLGAWGISNLSTGQLLETQNYSTGALLETQNRSTGSILETQNISTGALLESQNTSTGSLLEAQSHPRFVRE